MNHIVIPIPSGVSYAPKMTKKNDCISSIIYPKILVNQSRFRDGPHDNWNLERESKNHKHIQGERYKRSNFNSLSVLVQKFQRKGNYNIV